MQLQPTEIKDGNVRSTSSKKSSIQQRSGSKKPNSATQSALKSIRGSRMDNKEKQMKDRIMGQYEERQQKKVTAIIQTIYDDKLKYYKHYRKDFESKLHDLEKERGKIMRRKKNKREKNKALRKNTTERLYIVCQVIKKTFQHYEKQYYENDHYRQIKLQDIINEGQQAKNSLESGVGLNIKRSKRMTNAVQSKDTQNMFEQAAERAVILFQGESVYSSKKFIQQLSKFIDSPFKEDKKFAVEYLSKLTRDRINQCEEVVNALFYDKIFNLLLNTKDEWNRHISFQILSNMVSSQQQRHKLANQNYLHDLFEKMEALCENPEKNMKTLENLSWLVTLISFHQDMFEHIIKLNLLNFILKISAPQYPSKVRSNAVLAISLLTYDESLFDIIIEKGVIDLVMQLCRGEDQEEQVKEYSTLALVHFALNKKSINILIEKQVLKLFDTFGNNSVDSENVTIQTNVSWIFLALCNNGITGKDMLLQGITRDMFLVSCNPDYEQIRHLVITGFAELGRCVDASKKVNEITPERQRIKETSIVGIDEHMNSEAQINIDIILAFSISDNLKYQYTAQRALKDYILLTHDNLIPDVTDIIQAFVNGCLSEEQRVQEESANAISFLVTHRLVYDSMLNYNEISDSEKQNFIEKISQQPIAYILDSIMYLSGSDSDFIRTTAFSILSSLSKFSSECETVMAQISRDIDLPSNLNSKNHHQFIKKRLSDQKAKFEKRLKNPIMETKFTGLYSLLRLAQEPNDQEIEDASNRYIEFIQSPYNKDDPDHIRNENYFLNVWWALKNTRKPKILMKLLKVINFYIDQDESAIQSQMINPHTILWMLELMEIQLNDKYLCCITSMTLLKIVSKHPIRFEHQEVAIIRKFNQALQNIDVFDTQEADDFEFMDDDSEDSIARRKISWAPQVGRNSELQMHDQKLVAGEEHKASGTQVLSRSSQMQTEKSKVSSATRLTRRVTILPDLAQSVDRFNREKESGKIKIDKSEDENSSKKDSSCQHPSNVHSQSQLRKVDSSQNDDDESELDKVQLSSEPQEFDLDRFPQDDAITTNIKELKLHIDPKKIECDEENSKTVGRVSYKAPGVSKQMTQENMNLQPLESAAKTIENLITDMPDMITEENENQTQPPSQSINNPDRQSQPREKKKITIFASKKQTSSSTIQKSKKMTGTLYSAKGDKNTIAEEKESLVYSEKKSRNLKSSAADTTEQNISIDDIDKDNEEQVESFLRDSLIKSFMVIFTNDYSQHLLLNKDLIDIAFNCLEFCDDCSIEAKRHVSRLISIIFKFPQVQQKLMATEVVIGIQDLLNQKKNKDIIRNTIKACTYISMNYDFIKQSNLSLRILKSMMGLLDQMDVEQDFLKRLDKYNIILTIKNILQGDKENKRYFLEGGGTMKFIDIILNSDDIQLMEMSIQGIAEQASYKKFMVSLLNIDKQTELEHGEGSGSLKKIIKQCLDYTDNWHSDINLKDFDLQKKQAMAGEMDMNLVDFQNSKILDNQSASVQESQFDYSINDSIQIPEFMKNDLDQLNINGNEDGLNKYEDDVQVTRQGKIRNSTYYIIARAIKFGINSKFLIQNYNLIQRIIRDLSLQNENNFMFQNLLMIITNLKLETENIVDLIGNNYSQIIDQIYITTDKDRRVSLLKVLINLVLEASEELASNSYLFKKIFEICKDQRSDEKMIQNILWLATSLCEQNLFNKNFHLIIECMVQNQIMLIIWKSLCSQNEKIVLQALKLLTKLADQDVIRTKLFEQKEIFQQIKDIAASTNNFQNYQIEIQTALCKCLDKITQVDKNFGRATGVEDQNMQLQQIDQIKIFNKYLINLAFQKEYKLKRLDEPETLVSQQSNHLNTQDHRDAIQASLNQKSSVYSSNQRSAEVSPGKDRNGLSMVKEKTDEGLQQNTGSASHNTPKRPVVEQVFKSPKGQRRQSGFTKSITSEATFNQSSHDQHKQNVIDINQLEDHNDHTRRCEFELDDIERLENSNEMVQNIVCTLSNISNDFSLHLELVQNGIIECANKYIKLYLDAAKTTNIKGINEKEEGIQLSILPIGSLQLMKAVSLILMNLSQNQQIQQICISQGILKMILDCLMLHDYQVKTNLFKALGNFLISPHKELRKKAVLAGCLQEMLEQHQYSSLFKIRRICAEYLNQVSENDFNMFEINDMLQTQITQENHQNMNQPGAM